MYSEIENIIVHTGNGYDSVNINGVTSSLVLNLHNGSTEVNINAISNPVHLRVGYSCRVSRINIGALIAKIDSAIFISAPQSNAFILVVNDTLS